MLRYDVKLTGSEKLETYTEALLAHPALSVTRIAQSEESIYEVYGPDKADECAQQYAFLRLLWLANSIGMSLEESPESFIVQ